MILLKPSAEIMHQEPGLKGLMKHIELCGRTSYKSECDITDCSANDFVYKRIDSGHTAILEHGAIYLEIPTCETYLCSFFMTNKYSIASLMSDVLYVSTNYRVVTENRLQRALKFMCNPGIHHHKLISVRFIVDRGISHELVRHRAMSFVQESTRYCNYSKNRFGNEITVIEPCFLDINSGHYGEWEIACRNAEKSYFELIGHGSSPQEARSVLPNSLKTEVIVTGFMKDWLGGEREISNGVIEKWGFFPLRCASSAHPQMREVTIPLLEKFKKEVDKIFETVKY